MLLCKRTFSMSTKLATLSVVESNAVKQNLSITPAINFHVLQPHEVEEVSDIVSTTFVKHNPPTVYLKVSKEEMISHVRSLCHVTIGEKLSVVARCPATGTLLGAAIVHDAFSDLKKVYHSPKLNDLAELYKELDERAFTECHHKSNLRPGKLALASFVATNPKVGGMGVYKNIMLHVMKELTRNGYDAFYGQTTDFRAASGVISIFGPAVNQYGMVPFSTFQTVDGRYILKDLKGEAKVLVVDLLKTSSMTW